MIKVTIISRIYICGVVRTGIFGISVLVSDHDYEKQPEYCINKREQNPTHYHYTVR